MPRLALDADLAAVLLHDSIDNREAEASAYADRLGRKKWIENSGHDFSGNAGTMVGNFHSDAIAGKTAGADMDAAMLASLLPPLLDGLFGVHDQIEHRLLQLGGIGQRLWHRGIEKEIHDDVFNFQFISAQGDSALDDFVQIDGAALGLGLP